MHPFSVVRTRRSPGGGTIETCSGGDGQLGALMHYVETRGPASICGTRSA